MITTAYSSGASGATPAHRTVEMSNAKVASPARAGVRVGVQKDGRFLSSFVMPNIGAFSPLAALFIPTGWLPNASLARLVSPMITYMLRILIGYTGGKFGFDTRGGGIGVVAAIRVWVILFVEFFSLLKIYFL